MENNQETGSNTKKYISIGAIIFAAILALFLTFAPEAAINFLSILLFFN